MAITNQANFTSKYELPDGTQQDFSLDSNTVTTNNIPEELQKTRSTSKSYAFPGEEITQTINLSNTSPYEISNINFKDTLAGPATFKTGSVTIDDVPYTSFDATAGFDLPDSLAATSGTAKITYVMTINSQNTEPDLNASLQSNATPVYVTASNVLTYTADSTDFTDSAGSTTVEVVNNTLTIVKSVNKNVAQSGDTLTYTCVITNSGSFTNTDIVFTDAIPTGTTFVADSVTIDGITKAGYNPATGFALDDIAADASTTVAFNVTVN